MKKTTIILLFLSFQFSIGFRAYAGDPSQMKIVESGAFRDAMAKTLSLDHRPSITEVKEIFGDLLRTESINPEEVAGFEQKEVVIDSALGGSAYGDLLKLFEKNPALAAVAFEGPEVLATFEKVYPGGTYVGLGRDSAFLVDLMDAFYQKLGQSGRVEIAEVGRDSFHDTDLLIKYFEQLGLSLKNESTSPTFVPFDSTNFRESSQSTQLLKAILETCGQRPGCDKDILLKRLGFINTGPNRSMYQKNIISPEFAFGSVIQSQIDLEHFAGVLSHAASGPLIYTPEYHNSYSGLKKTESGRVVPIRGGVFSPEIRKQIILSQIALIKIVESDEFRRRVIEFAKNRYNFDFPMVRVTKSTEIDTIRGFVIREPLKNVLENLLGYLTTHLLVENSETDVVQNQKLLQDLFIRIEFYIGDSSDTLIFDQLLGALLKLVAESKVSVRSLAASVGSLGVNAGHLIPLFDELLRRYGDHANQKAQVQFLIERMSTALRGNSAYTEKFRDVLKANELTKKIGIEEIGVYLLGFVPDPQTYDRKSKFDQINEVWNSLSAKWSVEKKSGFLKMIRERGRVAQSFDTRIRYYLMLKGLTQENERLQLAELLEDNIREMLAAVLSKESSKVNEQELTFFLKERMNEASHAGDSNRGHSGLIPILNVIGKTADGLLLQQHPKAQERIQQLFDLYVQVAIECLKQFHHTSSREDFDYMIEVLSSITSLRHQESFSKIQGAGLPSQALTEYLSSISYSLAMVYDNTLQKRKEYFLKYLQLGEEGIVDQKTLMPIAFRYLASTNSYSEKNLLHVDDLSPQKFPRFFASLDRGFHISPKVIRPLIFLREKNVRHSSDESQSLRNKFLIEQIDRFFETDFGGGEAHDIFKELEIYLSEVLVKIRESGSESQIVDLYGQLFNRITKWDKLNQYDYAVVSFLKSSLRNLRPYLNVRTIEDTNYKTSLGLVELFAQYFPQFPDKYDSNEFFQSFLETELSQHMIEAFFDISMDKLEPYTKTIHFNSPLIGKLESLARMCKVYGANTGIAIKSFSTALSRHPGLKKWLEKIPRNRYSEWTLISQAEMLMGVSQLKDRTPESTMVSLIENSKNWPGSKSALGQKWFFDFIQPMNLDVAGKVQILKLAFESGQLDSEGKVSFGKLIISQFNSTQSDEFLDHPEGRKIFSKYAELRKAWESLGKSDFKKPGFCERALLRFK